MIIRWFRDRWRVIVVRGNSMVPTLSDGDRLLIRLGRAPRPGDLVMFRARAVVPESDMTWMVKRVARIEPDGGVYVRGDSDHSQDSRHFGPVPANAVLGVATSGSLLVGTPLRPPARPAQAPTADYSPQTRCPGPNSPT